MNKPAHPVAATPIAYPAYDEDGYGWAMAQAALIRAGRIDSIDWDNVAEEIESMGKSEYRSAESALVIILLHLLKWDHQITFRTRSWSQSIEGHLEQFDDVIRENPSLKSRLPEILAKAQRKARYEAAKETGLNIDLFPLDPPSWDKIRGPLPE